MLAINRNAIWNAVADLIEENPANYRFWNTEVPDEGEGGCLWGLAGRMIGVRAGTDIDEVGPAMGYTEEMILNRTGDIETWLYHALTDAMTPQEMQAESFFKSGAFVSWTVDTKLVVTLLRRAFPVGVSA